ncbi:hypothetical protein EB796_023587 [Bugula neritina]|uniref:NDUFAF6 n=1 Tax=Bugula neritina TaxID=10212 RepID=A0A7J7IW41_BUGNE|nr:hypothetical protein EB796_023587 [Bugula neritina]
MLGSLQHTLKSFLLPTCTRYLCAGKVHTVNKSQQSYQYAIDRVKTYDYESYLIILLGAKKWRYPMFVLHAYNVELSLILELAADARTLAGRFAFWTDVLNGVYSDTPPYDHPVVQELTTLHKLNLINSQQSQNFLFNMLTSRKKVSQVTHFETLDQLERYSEHTKSSLLYLLLNMSGESSIDTDHVASHVGRCYGLITALRSTPYLASKNQLLLPQDLLSKHKVSQSDVLRMKNNVKEVVFEMASVAHVHLQKTQKLMEKLPKNTRQYFLLTAICNNQLELLRKCDFNLHDPLFLKKNPMLPWHLWRAKRKL